MLLDQHIAETEIASQGADQAQGTGVPTPPAPSGNQGAGEIAGNEIAGAMGAMMGGGAGGMMGGGMG